MKNFVKTVVSFFGFGFLKPWPGTWGSLAGLAVVYAWPQGLGILTVLFSIAGLALCATAQKAFGEEDPQKFVLDEVCGMMLCLVGLPLHPAVVIAAFCLFRLLDSTKPWPIILFQRLKHPTSIMLDDLVAAIFVNLTLQIILRFVI